MAHDIIIIGGGHNGLTCAALLAKRGRKVLLLEKNDHLGGLADVLHDTTRVRHRVVKELGLESHGLKLRAHRPDVLALGEPGDGMLLPGEREAAARAIAARSQRDGEQYLAYRAYHDSLSKLLLTFLNEAPVDLVNVESASLWGLLKRALRLRSLGSKEMMELLRLPPMCVSDWLGEWFETDLLKAALALPAVAGTWTGPRSPGSNFQLLLWEAAAAGGVEGGGRGLVSALEKAARGAGVEIRTDAEVGRIVTEGRTATGVVVDGETLETSTVVAAIEPKHAMLDLLGAGKLPYNVEHKLRCYRTRGTTAQVHLTLAEPLRFKGHDGEVQLARTGRNLREIEQAFDAVKYRQMSERPVLEVHADGTDVGVLVHYAPYDYAPGWSDEERQKLGERVVAVLSEHASFDVRSREVLTPRDLSRRYGISGGHIHHGEHSLDQSLIRPIPEAAAYATPIAGLFLCSSGTHPGGGLTCAPGALAADIIAR